ncbi:MAG: tetratricopeptide repeat protein [Bacteroidales bacterium]|nr:tetratricopeptide repeat protein [Bacteroidales bacterium]
MESKIITLSQIGLYNPQRLSDDVVERLFVVRYKFFQFLMEKLNKEKPKSIPQHYLIIAQRGMGKTTLLKRIEVELRKQQYEQAFIPLLFPEEQYNLKNLAEFWLNSLDALADTLEVEKKMVEAKNIDLAVKELLKIKNGEDLAKEAFQFLKTFTQSFNRRPVMLIDNMSYIFDRLDKTEQHTLRAWLMQNGAPIVIGASAVAIENTYDYDAPFYDAFQIEYLQKLSFEELLDILINLAKLTQSEDIIPLINNQTARIKTLHQLTGGNPRTATMLFKLIIKGFSKDINDDLEALLDEITPLYKARFEELSLQMQVIVDAIALHWDPINIEQLREETSYENNQLSPQLKRLVEVGWIEKIDAYKAKGSAYQVSERFFNIWFLMRRSSRRQKKELYCLSKFLESFYGEEINLVAANHLLCKACNLNHVTYGLALAEVIQDSNLKSQLLEKSYEELRDFAKTNPEILDQFDLVQEPSVSELFELYFKEIGKENYLLAEKLLLKTVELAYSDKVIGASTYNEIGNLYQNHLQKYDEAEKAYQKAIEFNEKDAITWYNLGYLYQFKLLKYNEAEKAHLKAAELDEKFAYSWNSLGNLYQVHLKKYDEAEKAYLNAIEVDGKFAYPWNGLGNLYQAHLKKYDEAEKAYLNAIELDGKLAYPWNGLGNLYQTHLKKYDEAEKAYLKAIELDEKYTEPLNGLGNLYQTHLRKYAEAERVYLKAIELDEKFASPWNGLGNLYQDYFQKYDEAEKAYFKAVEFDNNPSIRYNLVFLLRDKMNRLKEAEELFNSIEIDEAVEDSHWLNKTLFELYKRNEGLAKNYFIKALEIIDNNLPISTQDDWWRFGAVVNKLGYNSWLVSIFEKTGYDIILSPYYVAVKAMNEKDTEGYLNSKAVEIREPVRKLIEIMKKY